jgi:hypothetical protein
MTKPLTGSDTGESEDVDVSEVRRGACITRTVGTRASRMVAHTMHAHGGVARATGGRRQQVRARQRDAAVAGKPSVKGGAEGWWWQSGSGIEVADGGGCDGDRGRERRSQGSA